MKWLESKETGHGGISGESHSVECRRCKAHHEPNLSGKQTEDKIPFCCALIFSGAAVFSSSFSFSPKKEPPLTGSRSRADVLLLFAERKDTPGRERAGYLEQRQKGEYGNGSCLRFLRAAPLAETGEVFSVRPEERIEPTVGLVRAVSIRPEQDRTRPPSDWDNSILAPGLYIREDRLFDGCITTSNNHSK